MGTHRIVSTNKMNRQILNAIFLVLMIINLFSAVYLAIKWFLISLPLFMPHPWVAISIMALVDLALIIHLYLFYHLLKFVSQSD